MKKKIFILGVLGFSAYLPFLLTLSTLHFWLKDLSFSNQVISFFAIATIPHSLSFIIVPITNIYSIPKFNRLGLRKSWLIISQLMVVFFTLAISMHSPEQNPAFTFFLTMLLSTASVIHKVSCYNYLFDISKKQYSLCVSSFNGGMKIAFITSGAGALHLSTIMNWNSVYIIMATLMTIGILASLIIEEPNVHTKPKYNKKISPIENILNFTIKPMVIFTNIKNWKYILVFILFFKMPDSLVKTMDGLFFYEIGFSKNEIANVSKIFSIISSISGALLAPYIIKIFSVNRSLIILYSIHISTNLLFIIQHNIGYNINMLFLVIGLEDFTGGMTQIAFLVYINSLCKDSSNQYRTMHNITIWSLVNFSRTLFSAISGTIAQIINNWDHYFLFTFLIALPIIILYHYIISSYDKHFFNKQSFKGI